VTKLLRLEIGRRARRQIKDLSSWWRINRTAAPGAVRDELKRVFRLILVQPYIGPPALDVALPDIRRIHLSRIGYYLYYRVLEHIDAIEVLALWSDRREEGPPV